MNPATTLFEPNHVIAASRVDRVAQPQVDNCSPAKAHDYGDHTNHGPARSLWPDKHSAVPNPQLAAAPLSPSPVSQRHTGELRARGAPPAAIAPSQAMIAAGAAFGTAEVRQPPVPAAGKKQNLFSIAAAGDVPSPFK